MRLFLLYAFSIFVVISHPAQAQEPQKPQQPGSVGATDLFITAYVTAEQGGKEEQAGHLNLALTKLQEATRILDEITAGFPLWSPATVKHRKASTEEMIARVQKEIAQPGSAHDGAPSGAGRPPGAAALASKNLAEIEAAFARYSPSEETLVMPSGRVRRRCLCPRDIPFSAIGQEESTAGAPAKAAGTPP